MQRTSDAGTAPPFEPIATMYARRLEARTADVARWERIDRRIGDARLAAFGLAVSVLVLALAVDRLSARWVLPFAGLFLGLVFVQEPARRRLERARRAREFYARGLARLEDRWPGTGVAGLSWLDEDHPYAADLDLFGAGSLFERLCSARTRGGEAMLASWLTAGGTTPATLRERQQAVLELRPCLDLREELELLGTRERAGIEPSALHAWGEARRAFPGRGTGLAVNGLSALNVAAVAAWIFTAAGPFPLLAMALATAVFARSQWPRAAQAVSGLENRTRDLVLLAGLLERIERQRFHAPALRRLASRLETEGLAASTRIAQLARLLHLLDSGRNQFFAPFAALLVWRTRFAVAVDAWRTVNGPAIRAWVEAVAEFEVLCSIAAYAAENPDDALPEILDGGAVFEADGLGHPLIPLDLCVRNDVRLGDPVRVLVLSGSNMSGKSTFLRTVGCNAVLAFTGAPVRASRLRISPLAPGATLRIQDSLQEGRSRFYAEITRVRQILDLTKGDTPVLFLFDEIFHGTNSSDRRIGAEAVLGSLLRAGAIGLATTHDLALADIADSLGPEAANVHFTDSLVDGELHFDYRMKPGVVQHSNALALMRSVGLEV